MFDFWWFDSMNHYQRHRNVVEFVHASNGKSVLSVSLYLFDTCEKVILSTYNTLTLDSLFLATFQARWGCPDRRTELWYFRGVDGVCWRDDTDFRNNVVNSIRDIDFRKAIEYAVKDNDEGTHLLRPDGLRHCSWVQPIGTWLQLITVVIPVSDPRAVLFHSI